jgi:hypothetical protein
MSTSNFTQAPSFSGAPPSIEGSVRRDGVDFDYCKLGTDMRVDVRVLRSDDIGVLSLDDFGKSSDLVSELFQPLLSSLPKLKSTVLNSMVTQNIEVWRRELLGDLDELFLLDGLFYGFSIIDDIRAPPRSFRRNYRSTMADNHSKVENRILEEIAQGNYVICESRPNNVSALGAVPKGEDDVRVIHDLSRPDGGVNGFAYETSVVYTTIDEVTRAISANSFIAKIDLKAAYRSIPIRDNCFTLTGLHWKFAGDETNTYMFDARLPFGASKSCRIFQSITSSICRMMANRGHFVRSYIDDFICVGSDQISCQNCFDTLIALIDELGLSVNWKKVCPPIRKMTFLGVVIDCSVRSLSLPIEKLDELSVLLETFVKKKRVMKLCLQRLMGKLNWASRVIRGGRSFMRSIIDLSCKVNESHHYVRINAESKMDLNWWIECLALFNGSCQFTCDIPMPSHCFASDACEAGGGAFLGDDWFHVNWELDFPALHGCHINELELATVVIALRRWGSQLAHCHVRIRSDNMATVSALNKSTSRCSALMPHIQEIFWLCVKFDLTISCVHIAGVKNILADRLSRLNEFEMAIEARMLLAGFVDAIITCRGHISSSTFVYLQEVWTQASTNCVVKRSY